MAQTIDLRKKQLNKEPLFAPVAPRVIPPLPEPEAENVESETSKDASTISWSTMLSRTPSKEGAWYLTIILFIAAAIIVYFRQDILFGGILVLAGIVIMLRSHSRPTPSRIHLDRTGILVNDQKYLYHEVGSFWLDYQPPHTKELSVQFKKIHHTPLRIPLESTNPLEIRALMIQFIPEKEHQQSLLDQLVRRLDQ